MCEEEPGACNRLGVGCLRSEMDLHHDHHDGEEFQALVDAPPDPDETDHIHGNLEHLIQLDGEEDAVVVYGHPQGARMGRVYKKSNWVVEEMLILQAAKREDVHRHSGSKGGSSSASSTPAQERWNWIEDYCWASGAHRSAQQCHDKWEVISTAYKKVHNNEKFGVKSYWSMTPEERKRTKLPPNFQKEIFSALLEWCNHKSKNSDSGELVVDTSGPLGPSGVKAELLDSEEESGEETSGPNQAGKKRKAWTKSDEALASILVRNNRNVVQAMLESEDRKDKRHREDLELERVKLELEKEKFRGAMKLGSGYIDALVNIGDGLKQLSAALCANIHS